LIETLAAPAFSEASTATIVEAIGVWFPGLGASSLSGATVGLGGMAPALSTDPIELAVSLVVSPGTTEAVPEARSPVTHPAIVEGIRAPRSGPLGALPTAGVDIATDTESTLREHRRRAEPREQPRHPPTARARPAGLKTSLERLRSRNELFSRRASGASTSAGGGASGLLIGVVAALIAFFVLAAPGIGRRIRPARLPSPHGRDDLRIDHPG
jgi:tetrahydromethanopterin S-methyltransferase subunit F